MSKRLRDGAERSPQIAHSRRWVWLTIARTSTDSLNSEKRSSDCWLAGASRNSRIDTHSGWLFSLRACAQTLNGAFSLSLRGAETITDWDQESPMPRTICARVEWPQPLSARCVVSIYERESPLSSASRRTARPRRLRLRRTPATRSWDAPLAETSGGKCESSLRDW